MSPFTQTSIRDEGLRKHLDSNYIEFGGYTEFVRLIKYGMSVRAIARWFHVSRPTVNKWIGVHKEESGK